MSSYKCVAVDETNHPQARVNIYAVSLNDYPTISSIIEANQAGEAFFSGLVGPHFFWAQEIRTSTTVGDRVYSGRLHVQVTAFGETPCYDYVVDAAGMGTHTTVQAVINDIATKPSGSEWSVFLCDMTTENVTVPNMPSGADHIWFMGKGAGSIPGLSGIAGVATVASPVLTVAQGAPELHFNSLTILGGTLTTKLVTHAPTNQTTRWTNCHFVNPTGTGAVSVDVSSALACSFRGCNFSRASISTTGSFGVDGLLVNGCYFIFSDVNLSSTQANNDVTLTGNHFDGGNCVINILAFQNGTITGNTFQSNSSTTTITLGGANTSQDFVISGNKFGGGSVSLPYIKFAANNQCRNVSITGNAFDFTANNNPFIVSANSDCQFVAIVGNVFGRSGPAFSIIGVSGTFSNSIFGPNAPGQRTQYNITGSENEFYPPASGSGGTGPFTSTPAPVDEAFVTIGSSSTLTAERALVASAPIQLIDGGPNGSATLLHRNVQELPDAHHLKLHTKTDHSVSFGQALIPFTLIGVPPNGYTVTIT